MTETIKTKKKVVTKTKKSSKEDPTTQFAPEIGEFFKKTLGFKKFTPVQVSFLLKIIKVNLLNPYVLFFRNVQSSIF